MHKTAIRSTLSIIVLILVLFTFQQIYCSYIRKVRSHLPPFLSVSLRSPISILEQDLIDEHILLDAFSHVRSHSSQNSGILLLLCRKTCRSLKLQLQEWIRLFNSNTNKTASEKVIFYFYAIRQQITRSSKHNGGIFPRVLYVGNESYANYDGALDNKRAFMKFLDDQRRVHIQDIMTVEQLHDILNEACSCNDRKHLIILSNPKRCPLRNFEGIIRNIRNVGEFSFYRLQRPLSTDLSVELFTRLAQLPDVCQIAIVLQNNAYTWTHIGQSSLELLSTIETWDNEDCTNTSGEWYRIGEELTEIEFMYQKEVARSESLEWKSTHIVVGATGGIAVVALAISIFWGLNGTAFTSHC